VPRRRAQRTVAFPHELPPRRHRPLRQAWLSDRPGDAVRETPPVQTLRHPRLRAVAATRTFTLPAAPAAAGRHLPVFVSIGDPIGGGQPRSSSRPADSRDRLLPVVSSLGCGGSSVYRPDYGWSEDGVLAARRRPSLTSRRSALSAAAAQSAVDDLGHVPAFTPPRSRPTSRCYPDSNGQRELLRARQRTVRTPIPWRDLAVLLSSCASK